MNDWIMIKSFANPHELYAMRINKLHDAMKQTNLEICACEFATIPDMLKHHINRQCENDLIVYRL